MTLSEKLQQIQEYAEQHKALSAALHRQNLVGEHLDVPALARALGVSLKAMGVAKRYCECGAVERSDDESLGEVLDEALAEITKILLPEEKV